MVSKCENRTCPLWPFRYGCKPDLAELDGRRPVLPVERSMTVREVLEHPRQRRTAIRPNCLECTGGLRRDIVACTTWSCPLYPFRLGTSYAVDQGDVVARQALLRKVGYDDYKRLINAELAGGMNDADLAAGEMEVAGDPEEDVDNTALVTELESA